MYRQQEESPCKIECPKTILLQQGVEKRHERRQCKAKFDEKAEFMSINEHFEENFNTAVASAIVFQHPADIL